MSNERGPRADQIAREIAIGGLSGLIAGVLIAGIGGRLFMRVAAAIDPSALGSITSNGNRIGEVTLGGTVGFIVFIGLLFGVVAGIIWVTVAPWVPGRGAVRALLTATIGAAITPFFVVKAGEPDFRILEPAPAVIAMVVGLAALAGLVVALADDRLHRRLPQVSPAAGSSIPAYRILTGVGLLFVPLAIGPYFTTESNSFRPPAEVGVALFLVGLATLASWFLRVRDGIARPPLLLTVLGRGALVTAVALGAVKVGSEVSAILGATGIRT